MSRLRTPGGTCGLRATRGCACTSCARTRSSRSPRGPWTGRRDSRSSRGRAAPASRPGLSLLNGPPADPGEGQFESVLEQKELEVSPGAIQIRGCREGVRANGAGRHVEDVAGGSGDGLAKLSREVGRRGFGVRVDERGGVLKPAVYRFSRGEHPARRQGGEVVGRPARALRGEDAQGSLHRRVGDACPGDGRPDRVAAEVRLAHELPWLPRRRADGHERAVESRRAAAERLDALERVAAPVATSRAGVPSPGMGSAPQTPSRRRPEATAASSPERNGSGANTETRSTPLKWPSRILPTEPSARATARSTLHSSANDERRLLPSWGSGAAIARTPDAARSLKGPSGKAGRASRSAAPEAIRERTDSKPVAVRARLAVPINAPVPSGSLALIRSRARHRDRRPGTVRTRESARA